MDKVKVAGELVRMARELMGSTKKEIGGIEFEAVKKPHPRVKGGIYWIFKVNGKEFDHMTYATKNKMWDDLEWTHKMQRGDDRWFKQFGVKVPEKVK